MAHFQGRFDSAIGARYSSAVLLTRVRRLTICFRTPTAKVCFELLLETFGRTIGRDLGERVVPNLVADKLVC